MHERNSALHCSALSGSGGVGVCLGFLTASVMLIPSTPSFIASPRALRKMMCDCAAVRVEVFCISRYIARTSSADSASSRL
ncbi:Uncharacterised protein [Mycobacteroides abscessus]|nr:Uncharacterised protein [Mycobacteroides abscessus]